MNFLRNIFVKQSEPDETSPDDTLQGMDAGPLNESDNPPANISHAGQYQPAQLLTASAHSVGLHRGLNEDSLFTLSGTIAGHHGSQPFGLFIVADGMGGHMNGEVASHTAIMSIVNHTLKKLHNTLFSNPSQPLEESIQEILQGAIKEAQQAVMTKVPGSGTTVTCALVMGQQITIAHIGDSRGYLMHPNGNIESITRDHSLVKRLEELGQITPAEAAVHPQRNVLYRAVGQGEVIDADISTTFFPMGSHLLLCSDGLWGMVSDEEMNHIIYTSPNIQYACQSLVNAANNAGGPDNITVILVQMLG